jgi:hypothetical protein
MALGKLSTLQARLGRSEPREAEDIHALLQNGGDRLARR